MEHTNRTFPLARIYAGYRIEMQNLNQLDMSSEQIHHDNNGLPNRGLESSQSSPLCTSVWRSRTLLGKFFAHPLVLCPQDSSCLLSSELTTSVNQDPHDTIASVGQTLVPGVYQTVKIHQIQCQRSTQGIARILSYGTGHKRTSMGTDQDEPNMQWVGVEHLISKFK